MEFETAGEKIIRERYRSEAETAAYISIKLDRSVETCLEHLKFRRSISDCKTFFWLWLDGQYYCRKEQVERYIRREQRMQRESRKAINIKWDKLCQQYN